MNCQLFSTIFWNLLQLQVYGVFEETLFSTFEAYALEYRALEYALDDTWNLVDRIPKDQREYFER